MSCTDPNDDCVSIPHLTLSIYPSAIDDVNVLEKGEGGEFGVGFKWEETRTMFGRPCTETMWITDIVEGCSYTTRAESSGAIYTSKLSITDEDDDGMVTLRFDFGSESVSWLAWLMGLAMGWMMTGSMKTMLDEDLADIKAVAEAEAK